MQQNLQQRCNQFETNYNFFFLQLKLWSIQNLAIIANSAFAAFSEGDELPISASGGNQIGGEIIRNKQCPHEADLRRLRMRKGETALWHPKSGQRVEKAFSTRCE
ncbi:MAG: hypothetical protein IKP72_02405 [Clostridia bacterium]|nr:hypothetical protein [Clostridia bacterium]